MNRNQRIVVSIVGIIIVTLALIGITYAYFMTKIIGNSTSKSISGTLANLELTYDDGNGIVEPDDLMMPGDTLEKTFSVQNTGTVDVDNYIVVLENVTNTLSRNGDLVYTLTCSSGCNGVDEDIFPSSDMPIVSNSIKQGATQNYTLTVTYKNYDDVDQSVDMGKKFEAKVNIKDGNDVNPYKSNKDSLAYKVINNALFITTEETTSGETAPIKAVYRARPLTKPLLETSAYLDQYEEKTFGEFSTGVSDFNLYFANDYTTSGSYFALTSRTKGKLSSNYSTLKGKYMSFWMSDYDITTDEIYEVIDATSSKLTLKRHRMVEKSKESTLSQISDVYGTSYYYRGNVENNYLTFNNMCWKIVRIQGDGSTKIVLQDAYAPCSKKTNEENPFIEYGTYGYALSGVTNYIADYLNCTSDSGTCMKNKLNSWFNSKFTSVKSKLKEETWYLESATNTFHYNPNSYGSGYDYYEAGQRLYGYGITKSVSLLTKTNSFNSYVGALTADEVVLAGAMVYGKSNKNYYLFVPSSNYLTLSLNYNSGSDRVFAVYSSYSFGTSSYINDSYMYYSYNIRPVIVLKPNTTVTGQGTKSDPYIVK